MAYRPSAGLFGTFSEDSGLAPEPRATRQPHSRRVNVDRPSALVEVSAVTCVVTGKAETKGSARGFVAPLRDAAGAQAVDRAGRPRYRAVITNDNPKAKAWERDVQMQVLGQSGGWYRADEPVKLVVVFSLTRPASSKRARPTVRPDATKLLRSIEDALTGVLFRDDSQVVEVAATKVYTDGPPRAHVVVSDAEATR